MIHLFPIAHAADFAISLGIPGMDNVAGTGPAGWIASFYRFSLFFSGILAFGAIVYGGFLYATSAGNSSRQSEGKSWIQSALLGLLLLAGAYVILYTINPGLTNLQIVPISPISH